MHSAEYNREYYAKNRVARKADAQRRFMRQKVLGLCSALGCKETPVPGLAMCAVHREKQGRKTRKSKYKLTYEELARLEAIDACMVCGKKEGLCIDHSHTTGRVRGVLCRECNLILGHAGDSPERLRNLAQYLEDGSGMENHS